MIKTPPNGTAKIEGDMVMITVPRARLHALMVAVQACKCTECRAVQSKDTEATRAEFMASMRRVLTRGKR